MRRPRKWFWVVFSCACWLGCSGGDGKDEGPGGPPRLVESLARPVEVFRDEWGIPHIYAEGPGDLLFMQGYETARDRIFQMDHLRRYIYGTQAEVYGESFLEDDITKRTFQFRRLAEANLARLRQTHPETVDLIQSYCNGVNAYLEDMKNGRNGATRPIEFDRIDPDYQPDPWEVTDVVALAKAQIFSQSFMGEIEMFIAFGRLLLLGSFEDLLRFQPLEPTYILEPSPTTTFPGSGPGGTEGAGGELEAALASLPDDGTRVRVARALLGLAHRLRRAFGGPRGAMGHGSNNWVVDDALTADGACILCNDPHMTLDIPSTMVATHIVDLTRDEVGAIGNTIPGAPMVLIGHTADLAWGLTNGFGDVTDLYLERLSRDGKKVLFEGAWVPLDLYEERILVRPDGGTLDEVREEARTVRWVPHHGPLVTDLLPEEIRGLLDLIGVAFSARWPGFSDQTTDMAAIRGVMEAKTVEEAQEALTAFNSGVMNWVLADSSGNIGYMAAGPYPVRADPVSAYPPYEPLPGSGGHEWQGFLDPSLEPRLLNPDKGYIVTANNTISDQTLDNNPVNDEHYWGHFFDLGTRAWRITQRLEAMKAAGPIRIEDLVALQTDVYAVLAKELLPHLLSVRDRVCAEPASPSCRALDVLASWDMNFDRDSAGASLFSTWYAHFCLATLADDMPPFFRGMIAPFLSQLAGRDLGAWLAGRGPASGRNYFDDLRTHGVVETAQDQMATALGEAVSQLAAFFGPDRPMETWRWGDIHWKTFGHPVWDDLSQGPFENDGGLHSVDPAEYPIVTGDGEVQVLPYMQEGGPALRFCVEMKEGEWRTYNVLPGGESGHFGDPHYADQIPLWLANEVYPFRYLRRDVEEHAVDRHTYPAGFPSAP